MSSSIHKDGKIEVLLDYGSCLSSYRQKLIIAPKGKIMNEDQCYDTHQTRSLLHRTLDAVELDSFCMDYFREVFDKFGRSMRNDEKINLLLSHHGRTLEERKNLTNLVTQWVNEQRKPERDIKTSRKNLKREAHNYGAWLLLITTISATLVFGFLSYVASNLWQFNFAQRLITIGVFFLAPVIIIWRGLHRGHIIHIKLLSFIKKALILASILFLIGGIAHLIWTKYKPPLQVSPCLELDLISGPGQKICPNTSGNLVLSHNSIEGLQNLSGQAILTHARGYTCEWKGQTKEGNPLLKLHKLGPTCNFSFELPEGTTSGYYLTLIVDGQHKLFIISIETQ